MGERMYFSEKEWLAVREVLINNFSTDSQSLTEEERKRLLDKLGRHM